MTNCEKCGKPLKALFTSLYCDCEDAKQIDLNLNYGIIMDDETTPIMKVTDVNLVDDDD